MKKMILLLIAGLMLAPLVAIHDDAGTSGFAFLKMSFYAKAAAMANAFTAESNDANTVFYNPAGLANLSSKKASSTYMSYFDGINTGSISFAFPYKNGFKIAVFSQFLSAKEDRTLVDADGNYSGKDGTFGASNLVFGIAAAKTFNPSLDLGFSMKFINESLDSNSASAIAMDVSVLHQTANENVKVGVVIKNLGAQISYHTDEKYKEKLPTMYIAGFQYLVSDKITANLDLVKPATNDFFGCVGLEYRFQERFALRSGYKTNSGSWKMGGETDYLSGLSFGFGVFWNQFDFDYALVSYGDLGLVNQLSLSYRF
jgi:hypothetical protein